MGSGVTETARDGLKCSHEPPMLGESRMEEVRPVFAIVQTGGKQYKVQEGDTIRVEKLNAEEGSTVQFDEVLAVSDENGLKIGTPVVEGASVEANVTGHGKGKKVIIFKYKPKKNYRKKQGHRQPYTQVQITKING